MSNSCKARIDSPAGLVVETAIISSSGPCRVDSKKSASHVIEVHNRTPILYAIMIKGECETPYIRYGNGDDMANSWESHVLVPPRPATGGSSQVVLYSDLTCTSAGMSEMIRTSVSISPADSEYSVSAAIDSVLLVVETLG
jgi:hypothetical protein